MTQHHHPHRSCRWIPVIAVVLFFAAGALAGPTTRPATQPSAIHRTITKTVGYDYLVTFPPGYDGGTVKQHRPLLIFLHGSGECGHDLSKVAGHGPARVIDRMPDWPFVLVSPQSPSELDWWDVDSLNAVLDDVLAKYDVDPDRVYLTGLSMGGYAVWDWAVHAPQRFAAIAPISGEPNTDLADVIARAKLPVWAFHGAKDKEVWPHEDQKMVELIRQKGGDARLTLYDDAGHDAWTRAYADAELYRWLLSHRLSERRGTR
jgi:predicted peptidase